MNAMQSKILHWFSAATAVAILAGCSSGGAPTVVNPVTTAPPVLRLHRSRFGQRRRAGLPHQPVGEHQGQQPLRLLPRRRRPDADVRPQRRREPRLPGGQHGRESHAARSVAHGREGRRRPQLLAAVALGLRRHAHRLDPQLGGRERHRRHADPAAGSDHQGSGRQQELPGFVGGFRLPRLLYALVRNAGTANCVRCHSSSAASQQQPFFADADVGRGLRGHQVEDQSRQPRGSRAWSCACATSSTTAGAPRVARPTRRPCSMRSTAFADGDPDHQRRSEPAHLQGPHAV